MPKSHDCLGTLSEVLDVSDSTRCWIIRVVLRMRSRHGPLASFRLAAVGHVLQMSFARGGVFADWVVGVSVGSTRPSPVLSGSCRFAPSCLTMWPHVDLIGHVFLTAGAVCSRRCSMPGTGPSPNRTCKTTAIREVALRRITGCSLGRNIDEFSIVAEEMAVAERAVDRIRSGDGVPKTMRSGRMLAAA